MTHIVKIFSASVLGATFPKPTDVSEVKVKYSAVTYRDFKFPIGVAFRSSMAKNMKGEKKKEKIDS